MNGLWLYERADINKKDESGSKRSASAKESPISAFNEGWGLLVRLLMA
jgi:hypothetical protein